MSTASLALSIRGLSKEYQISRSAERHSTAAEALLHRFMRPFARSGSETYRALNDISFDITKGKVVGIIGRNGAGKSTFLKILSRITEPTRGEVKLFGRVGSLLEVGTGFHPELTGRENIYLNGSILGMRRGEIDREFDAIVEFSGIQRFLDTPVKRYSSGMYVRLAFGVAAHLQSEILVVDEVLAVGDAAFQKNCLGKMKEVANSGRTVLFVSHSMSSVAALCNEALILDRGQLAYHGKVREAIDQYSRSFSSNQNTVVPEERRDGSGEYRYVSVFPDQETFSPAEEKRINFTFQRRKPYHGTVFMTCHIVDDMGRRVASCDSRLLAFHVGETETFSGQWTIRTPWLMPGTYRIDTSILAGDVIDRSVGACYLSVNPMLPYPDSGNTHATAHGAVTLPDFDIERV